MTKHKTHLDEVILEPVRPVLDEFGFYEKTTGGIANVDHHFSVSSMA